MTIHEFIQKCSIRFSCEEAEANPNMLERQNMNHWKITLKMGRRQYTLFFSQGFGIKRSPTAEGVLDCLRMEQVDTYQFADWCEEFGYNEDSRRAEKIYKICKRETAKMKKFLGDSYEEFLLTEEVY